MSGLWQALCELHDEIIRKMIWAKVTVFHWHQTEKHKTVDLGAQFYVPVFEWIWYKSQDHHSVLKKWLDTYSHSSCWQLEFESCFSAYHSKLPAIAGNLLLHHWPKHWAKLLENVRYCKIFMYSMQSNANELLVSFLQDLGKNVAAIPYGVLGKANNITWCF